MHHRNHSLAAAALISILVCIGGCSSTPQDDTSPSSDEGHMNHGDAGHAHQGRDQADIERNLAQLTVQDRVLAESQKLCPVSDEPLGSMGKPLKIDVGERAVFICCEGCEDALKENPKKFLAKLPPVK